MAKRATLDDFVKRATERKERKTVDVYVESLDAVVTLREPSPAEITDALSGNNPEAEADRYLVYLCMENPKLTDSDLLNKLGIKGAHPELVVDRIFTIGERSELVQELMKLAGINREHAATKVIEDDIEEVKN